MTNFKIFFWVSCLTLTSCGALANLASNLTSTDCDDFLLNELSSSLSEECRELEGYLEESVSSLTNLSLALPVTNLAVDKAMFLQITDDAGAPLTDLASEDISVEYSPDGTNYFPVEDATLEPITEADPDQVSLLSVMDYSGSILDSDLDDVVGATNLFLNALEIGYRGGLVKFSTEVDLIQDFTTTEADLIAAVTDTNYDRAATSLYDAIYDGVSYLSFEESPLRLMLLFTDGVDNDSTRTYDQAISHARENNIPVCVIGVGFADTGLLENIAEDTGCFYIYKTLFSDLEDAFRSFAAQLNGLQVVNLPAVFAEETGTLRTTIQTATGTRTVLRTF